MKDIRVYDFEFNLLCVMTDVVSASWHILYNGVGSFEGHFRLKDSISNIILSNKYIVLCQGNLQAICTGKIVTDELVVCGRTVNWILTRRVRPPFKTREIFGDSYTDPETILLYCLKKAFLEPPLIDGNGLEIKDSVDNNKRITNFIVSNPVGAAVLDNHFWRVKAHDLSELTIDLCKKLNRGHRVIFDIEKKQWRFEFIFPKNREVMLCQNLKSIYDISYSEDLQQEANGGWYPAVVDESENSDNLWYYIQKEKRSGIYAWDCVINSSGKSEAVDMLGKKTVKLSVNGKLRNLKYMNDYELGDMVSVYVKFGNYEKHSKCMVNGVDICMTRSLGYEEPDLVEV